MVRLNKFLSSVVMNIREIRGSVEATGDRIGILIFVISSLPLWPLGSNTNIQRDSKRWTQFRTSIFLELYMVCE